MSLTMAVSETDAPIDLEVCKSLLDRVISSTPLKRSARLRDLLTYVGRRVLEDGSTLIREQEIGIEVFGREEGYDTTADNIVRVNATELRKRIDTYFETEGSDEPVAMEIPRGGYVPVFRYRTVTPALPVEPEPVDLVSEGTEVVPEPLRAVPEPAPRRARPFLVAGLILLVVVAAGLLAMYVSVWMQNRSLRDQLTPWQNRPAEANLWSQFMTGSADTDIVVGDSSLGLVEDLEQRQISLQDYINRSYLTELQSRKFSPDADTELHLLERRTLVSRGSYMMTQRLLAAAPHSGHIHTYFARSYNPSQINRDNVILLGGRLSNPWIELFENRMNFVVQHNFQAELDDRVAHASIVNRAPAAGEQAIYTPSPSIGYCTIAYLPNPEHSRNALILTGTSSEAAEGCGQFLLTEEMLAAFREKLHAGNNFPYFEALLKTSHVAETPLATSLVAFRVYPNLH